MAQPYEIIGGDHHPHGPVTGRAHNQYHYDHQHYPGHCICKSCYQGINSSCPVCRTKMPKATSLLAVTVIEQIEHRCRNQGWGCSARLALPQVDKS